MEYFVDKCITNPRITKQWDLRKNIYKDVILSAYIGYPRSKLCEKYGFTRQRAMQLEHKLLKQIVNFYTEIEVAKFN